MRNDSRNEERRVAILTGAGSGIGRAVALQLLVEGWAVVLVGRDRAKLQATARNGDPSHFLVYPADVSVPQAAGGIVAATVEKFGRLDALCNVAGFAALASIEQTTDELWRTTLDTNLGAAVHLTRAAWPVFKRRHGGVVVNVSSMASIDPFPGFVAYACSKVALNMLTLFTAREGEPIGVKAVAIAPGAVETPMLRSAFDEKAIPTEATLRPQRVAELICDCVTGRRDYRSGETITITPD